MDKKEEGKKTWVAPVLKEISTKKFEGGAGAGVTENATYHS